MIEVKNISKAFDGREVLRDVSFTVNQGECVALTGASGSGKTTLLRIIAGLERPDSGSVYVPQGLRKTFVFQENRLFENKTVLQNVLNVAPDRERALYFLERCALIDDVNKKAGELSGGMKRRLAIVRALSFGGDIYYLDEPLRELDGDTLRRTLQVINEEITGKTAILITQDEYSLKFLSDSSVNITQI